LIKSRRITGDEYCHVSARGEIHTGFWWENLTERDNLEEPEGDGKIILKMYPRDKLGLYIYSPSGPSWPVLG
jgi:hypothetical protein